MNALFLVLDTVRRDFLSCYGNKWVHTPNLDKLAGRGVVFDNHWAGSLPCMPARREFMTGLHNFLYRGWGPIEPYDDTLPKWLREKKHVFSHLLTDHYHYFELGGENYHVLFNTWEFFRGQENDPWASHVDQVGLPPGWNNNRREQSQLAHNYDNRSRQQNEEDFSASRTCASAVEWLEANRDAKGDWFLQVELFDPHEPFYTTNKYMEMYGAETDRPVNDWPPYDYATEGPQEIEHIRKCYAGLLSMTDHWAGKVLDKLEEIGVYDDTLIVFTTDHGSMLAEHGAWLKNYMPLYNQIVHLPLIMKLPGNLCAGKRVGQFSQTIDLMPTFLDYFGVSELPPHMHGQSLRPAAEHGASTREDGIFGYFGLATNVTDGRYVYMRMPVNDDHGPLHAYTAMPTKFGSMDSARNDQICMGRYFGHTYNLPLYKIPAAGGLVRSRPGEASYLGRHLLFDTQTDPSQDSPLQDRELEEHFCSRIVAHLRKCEAPEEQYTRIGLSSLA